MTLFFFIKKINQVTMMNNLFETIKVYGETPEYTEEEYIRRI